MRRTSRIVFSRSGLRLLYTVTPHQHPWILASEPHGRRPAPARACTWPGLRTRVHKCSAPARYISRDVCVRDSTGHAPTHDHIPLVRQRRDMITYPLACPSTYIRVVVFSGRSSCSATQWPPPLYIFRGSLLVPALRPQETVYGKLGTVDANVNAVTVRRGRPWKGMHAILAHDEQKWCTSHICVISEVMLRFALGNLGLG